MIYRTLGKTGERVSAIGMGGFHIGQPKLSDGESLRLIRAAIDGGINSIRAQARVPVPHKSMFVPRLN